MSAICQKLSVRAESVDARVGKPGDLAPERARLVVFLKDAHAQMLRIGSFSSFGDEFPREADRVALEVVAKREIAEHLEERVMPRGVADLLEIVVLAACADALLHVVARRPYGGCSWPRKTFLNCTIPAFVNMSVGSSPGTTGELGSTMCPCFSKYDR